MLFTFDPDSNEPLYRQLRKKIEASIAAGEFEDKPLPSSRALSSELGVSRNIVTLAYQELIAEGFVASRPRSGLFVNREVQRLLRSQRAKEVPRRELNWAELVNPDGPDDRLPHVNKPRDWHRHPYPFLGGQFSNDTFPLKTWMRALRQGLDEDNRWESLQDSQGFDDPLLVEQLCDAILPGRGITAEPDDVLVTTGSQEGLFLVSQALLRPGTTVAVEDPGYPDAKHIMRRAGAGLMALPVDQSGAQIPDDLSPLSGVYLTPSHQFPTNVTLSIARRKQLLTAASSGQLPIIEDDYDSEFRYHGRPTPALKALDDDGHVIYLGSFSKFLAPGLRLGYMVAAPALIAELRDRRRYMIRHPSGHLQRALALLIASGDYARSVRRSRVVLKDKWHRIVDASGRHLPWTISPQAGGISIWLTGPESLDTRALAVRAQARGVIFEPGDTFFLGMPAPTNHARLGFASVPKDRIEEGVRILGELARE